MRFEKYWYWTDGRGRSVAVDALAGFVGWLVLLTLDPLVAWVAGVPLAVLLVAGWRFYKGRLREGLSSVPLSSRSRWSGRLALLLLVPVLSLSLCASAVCASTGAMIGFAGAALTTMAAEALFRNKRRSLIGQFPLLGLLALVATAVLLSFLFIEAGFGPRPNEGFLKRISQPAKPPVWSQGAKGQAIKAIRAVLGTDSRGKAEDVVLLDLYRELAPETKDLWTAAVPYGLYVTLYERTGARARGYSTRSVDGLEAVLHASQVALRTLARQGARRVPPSRANLAVQVDLVGPTRRSTSRPLLNFLGSYVERFDERLLALNPFGKILSLACDIEPGIDGLQIRIADNPRAALMLPSDPITYGWLTPRVAGNPLAVKTLIRRTLRRDYGTTFDLGRVAFTVDKFRTTTFGALATSAAPIDWYRGNALSSGTLTRAHLVEHIVQAVDWLSRQVQLTGSSNEVGRFRYESFPPYQKSTQDYSFPRHAGGTYGLFAFYRVGAREPQFSLAAQRALQAGLATLELIQRKLGTPSHAAPGATCFIEDDGTASSGASALALLALAELVPSSQVTDDALRARVAAVPLDKLIPALGACVLSMIDPDGAVFVSYDKAQKERYVEEEPLYFPGEVLFALVRGYARLGDPRFLEGAKRIADRQLRYYRWSLRLHIPRAGDHWMIQGLADLAALTRERRYAELALLLGRGYLNEQHPPNLAFYPDYIGSYYRFFDVPRTTRAASRGEALGGAVKAAAFLGQPSAELDAALIAGARHLIEQQFVAENSYFIPDDFDLQGAIRMGLVDNHCRIDNNQHGLIALLRALEAMDRTRR
jgi:hypothetical protein